jgi:hypothetical protein
LDFLNEVVLEGRLAFDAQHVVRIERAVHELIARGDLLAFDNAEMRVERNFVFDFVAFIGRDDDDTFGLLIGSKRRENSFHGLEGHRKEDICCHLSQ